MRVHLSVFVAIAGVALLAAACGGDDGAADAGRATPQPSPGATASAPAGGEEMQLQPGAENMTLQVLSPAAGETITTNSVDLQVSASGFDLSCDLAGKPNQEGKGHYHVLLDRALVNMYCTEGATLSLQNLQPGAHTIAVVPALNDHAEVLANETHVEVDFQPATPPAPITDTVAAGNPTVKVLEPKPGTTVSGDFDVVIEVSNFNLSCDLLGKPNVSGYGHWHLNLDTTTGAMMGMATMMGMSCETVFHASTAGLTPGSTHSVIALLTDNQHVPLETPAMDQVEVTVR